MEEIQNKWTELQLCMDLLRRKSGETKRILKILQLELDTSSDCPNTNEDNKCRGKSSSK